MARRTYTDRDQARIAVTLQANEGNVKRTSRELDVPISTVRDLKNKWERDGYPEAVEDAMPAVTVEVTDEMQEVRNLAIQVTLEKLREGKVSAKDAAWIAGVFTDKIRLARGEPTSRTETVQIALPDATELAKELARFVAGTVDAAQRRDEEIEDADWEQVAPAALPAAG